MPISTLSSINTLKYTQVSSNNNSNIVVNNVSATNGYNYTVGTSTTSNTQFDIYSFTSSTTTPNISTYTINYNCSSSTYVYVLAVGGGGAGGFYAGGGGGAGAVIMKRVLINNGTSNTINIAVGAGGAASTVVTSPPASTTSGYSTIITFSDTSIKTITAGGGSAGGNFGSGNGQGTVLATTNYGGSTGGTSHTTGAPPALTVNSYVFVNEGSASSGNNAGCGGGAGGPGGVFTSSGSPYYSYGAPGVVCSLPGIKDYNPNGTPYGNYYWGGSGAVGFWYKGYGGKGGGGGAGNGSTLTGSNDTNGINVGTQPTTTSGGIGGDGGPNTGGGGGGGGGSTARGGNGGSGIVIIAIPKTTYSVSNLSRLTDASFSSTAYNSMVGAYGCKLLNYNYYGPIMNLRWSTDTNGCFITPFYSDTNGNLTTMPNGAGLSITNWISSWSGYAVNNGLNDTLYSTYVTTQPSSLFCYVQKWYSQADDISFNCGKQNSRNIQPIYDVVNKIINFGYTGAGGGVAAPQTGYFNLNSTDKNMLGNCQFTITAKCWNGDTVSNWYYYNTGTQGSSGCITSGYYYTGGVPMYRTYFWGPDFNTNVKFTVNGIVTYVRNNVTGSKFFLNGVQKSTQGVTTLATTSTSGNIGYGGYKFQLYYLYISYTPYSDTDRTIIEST